MRCPSSVLPVVALIALVPSIAHAQYPPLYVRHSTPLPIRQAPIPSAPQPSTLTPQQQLAIAPVKYPTVWPAPSVPAGTVLTVPPRPNWMPQPGEYWGPFTDNVGGWGFMVGPMPAPPAPAVQPASSLRVRNTGSNDWINTASTSSGAPSLPPPVLPVAGPVSPDGRMVVTYPDGTRVTWQFPMIDYKARVSALGPDNQIQLIDSYGRRGSFTIAQNARITLNGQTITRKEIPVGASVSARALRNSPTDLRVLVLTR
jgi:hypothetical protein